jgi:hypothetical protein
MQLKGNKTNKKLIYAALLLGGCLVFFAILTNSKAQKKDKKTKDDLELKTEIVVEENNINFQELIDEKINLIHSDSILNIHLVRSLGINNLVFIYKNELVGRKINDNFFIHLFIKDASKVLNGKYINLDFIPPKVKPTNIGNHDYFIFKKALVSENYKGKYVDLEQIDFINAGRYKPGLNRSYSAQNIKVKDIKTINLSNSFETVNIFVKNKAFEKIRAKRDEAIKNGILITSEDDIINAEISINNGTKLASEFRLKGDLPDHLLTQNKWSYRFIMKGEETFNGLRKFSIQHPKVRNYMWEWLFHKVIKDSEIIGLRYDYTNVEMNLSFGKDSVQKTSLGIMAIEESFDKILIENNKKREGLILAFDESLLWKDRKKQISTDLSPSSRSSRLHSLKVAPIKVFNQNKVLSDPKLAKQFGIAKDLLEGLRSQKYKISEVFDIEKLTMFTALSNLFGGHHGLIWHNLRIYYNPITNKLEPIAFDTNSGTKITSIQDYPMFKGDELYDKLLLEKLKLVSSTDFINTFAQKYYDDLNTLQVNLNSEFNIELDLSILEYNSNFIKKHINPSDILTANLIKLDDKTISLEIQNLSKYPVEIISLVSEKGRKLNTKISTKIIEGLGKQLISFNLNKSFNNAFVSKKNKKGGFRYPKDVDKLKLKYSIAGLDYQKESNIIPYGTNQDLDKSVINYKEMFRSNFKDFAFVNFNKQSNTVYFKSGKYTLDKTINIPAGLNIIVEEGFELNFKNRASLISYSAIFGNGKKDNPIKFFSSDGSGGGVFVTDAAKPSKLDFCIFSNLSNPVINIWELSGAVNFHESNVEILNSIFENNNSEDGLNIIRSKFSMGSTIFKNTFSDAFDGDFVTGEIYDSKFFNCGNDGIDVSGSQINLRNVVIEQPSDKAISGGEASTITGKGVIILGGEIGVVSKDSSKIELSDVVISDTRLGLSSFQKKSEYGIGIIEISNLKLVNNELDYLVENGSQLSIDNIPVKTVSNNVIDQMYGNEYGKSSK